MKRWKVELVVKILWRERLASMTNDIPYKKYILVNCKDKLTSALLQREKNQSGVKRRC
jgi:hypothetical protein